MSVYLLTGRQARVGCSCDVCGAARQGRKTATVIKQVAGTDVRIDICRPCLREAIRTTRTEREAGR